MIKGTTPSLIFKVRDSFVFEGIDNIRVSIESGSKILVKELGDLDIDEENRLFKLFLTQEETFALATGDIKVQVHVLYDNGTSIGTLEMRTRLNRAIVNEVIKPYGE